MKIFFLLYLPNKRDGNVIMGNHYQFDAYLLDVKFPTLWIYPSWGDPVMKVQWEKTGISDAACWCHWANQDDITSELWFMMASETSTTKFSGSRNCHFSEWWLNFGRTFACASWWVSLVVPTQNKFVKIPCWAGSVSVNLSLKKE